MAPTRPGDLVPPVDRGPDLVWDPDDVRRVWEEEGLDAARPRRCGRARPVPAEPAVRVRGPAAGDRRARARARPRTSSAGSSAPGTASWSRSRTAARPSARPRSCARSTRRCSHPATRCRPTPALRFAVAPARRGFVWRELGLVLLPDTQVFRKRPPRADRRLGRALASFADLRVGDYVVHEDHGVGKLLGFETKEVAGVTRDYLYLAFRGEDRLYVPHEQLGKLSKYIGADAGAPALSKLGGKAWQNLKARARASVRELAGELLQLYAQRQRAEGTAYDLSSDWLERLEASFPYRETDDQQRAIEAVKEDLESARPMDRLVCGDVGFGKTEVAVRAAFAVAISGRQVLVLCPTTILAEQHWNTFRERYRDFPVRVEMVSRFRRPAEVKQVLREFAEGKVEVLVGTHRILSRDVIPKQLGLVVVDEEQRFGVSRRSCSGRCASRSTCSRSRRRRSRGRSTCRSRACATSRSSRRHRRGGGRSARSSASSTRRPCRVALEREHAREGQSFYLHNRVESIDEAAEKLRQLCPGLRFLVAHGQMPERELEERMHAFLAGDADVLVSTTIIESGLDIPQANTLVVERADTLGLAQLYQIRGRVGRSDVTAHAYLFYPDRSELTPEARARLATLADHTELGAGFQIAMRDLEIRGAGDLLGAEQSGHVAALGFELYVEMLNEAVAELTGQARVVARPVRVDARVDAYVPAAYIEAEALKIDLHRRIALAEHEDELRELRAATEDRYGPIPEPVENLFRIQEAKLALALVGADYLVFRGGRVRSGRSALVGRAARAPRPRRDCRLHLGAAGSRAPHRGPGGGARARRCYRCRPPGRLRGASAARDGPNESRTRRNPSVTAPRLQKGLDEALAPTRRRRTRGSDPCRRRLWRLRRGAGRRCRRRRRDDGHPPGARRPPRPREEVLHRAEARVPEGGDGRVPVAPDPGSRVPRPARGVRARGREARHRVTDAQIDKKLDEVKKQYFSNAEEARARARRAGLHRRDAARRHPLAAHDRGDLRRRHEGRQGHRRAIRKYYDQNKKNYTVAESRAVRHILVKTKAEADKLQAELEGGADFAALAKQNSLDPGSKNQGGQLTITRGQTVAPFDKAAFSLKTNELSAPVKTEFGYHLIQPTAAVKKGSVTPFAQVKAPDQDPARVGAEEPGRERLGRADPEVYEDKVQYAAGFEPPATSTATPPPTASSLRRVRGDDTPLEQLRELTRRLRAECPWDREQTARTIVPHTVEEAYEVADAALAGRPREAPRRARRPALPGLLPLPPARGAGRRRPRQRRGGRPREARPPPPARLRRGRGPHPGRVRERWEAIKSEQEGRRGIFHDVPATLPRCSSRGRCNGARRRWLRLADARRARSTSCAKSSTSCSRRSSAPAGPRPRPSRTRASRPSSATCSSRSSTSRVS